MQSFKRIFAMLMCVVMTLTVAPLDSFVGIKLPGLFSYEAKAANTPTVYSQLSDKESFNYPGGSGSTYSSSGCGVYAIVNSIKYLTGKKIDPHKLGEFAINCGARVNGGVRGQVLSKKCAESKDFGGAYGFYMTECYTFGKYSNYMRCDIGGTRSSRYYPTETEWNTVYNKLVSHLSKGEVAVVLVLGHYMSIVDYDSSTDKFLILDSAPYKAKRLTANGGRYQWVTANQLNYNKAPSANSAYNNQGPYIHLRQEIMFFAKTEAENYTLDVNYLLNGDSYNKENDVFTFDMYINGELVANDVSDYCKGFPTGTEYKISDIKTSEGYDYIGVNSGVLEGTISKSNVGIQLNFITPSEPELISTIYYGNSKYDLYSGCVSWKYAKYLAEKSGGYLAAINSAAEEDIVASLSANLNAVWIGANDEDNEGTWEWCTGEKFSYKNWQSGEPSNGSGGGENYLALYGSTGYWNDFKVYSTSVKGFVVESNIGDSWVNFNVNYDDIGINLFRSPCDEVTVNGITYSFDSKTQILTLNGSTNEVITQIGSVAFWPYVGDTYTASCYYISGSVTNGEFCYDVCGENGNRLSNRKYLSCKNVDLSSTWEFTEKDPTNTMRENSAGSYLKLWAAKWPDNNDAIVFDNYKIKLKLEKGTLTEYSPARVTVQSGEGYGKLPDVGREGYTFAGWYTDPEEGDKIDYYSECNIDGSQTLYAHWEPYKWVTTFDLNYDNIGRNMFQSPCEEITLNGITYSYDTSTGILTLNGSAVDTVTEIGSLPFWVSVGDTYTASCYYISGSVTNGELCYDVCGQDGYRLSSRKYLSCKNQNSSSTWNFTQVDPTDTERENAAGSYLKLWAANWGGSEEAVVFDNYKIKIKLEDGSTKTEYTPARIKTYSGDGFKNLPVVSRNGYTFEGWYTEPNGGTKITESTLCTSDAYKVIYAHWKDTSVPTGKIASTNDVSSKQTITLTLQDNAGVAGYYWGANSIYSNNTYIAVSSAPISINTTQSASSAGVYYLTVKDVSGNISSTYTVTFCKTTLNANNGTVSTPYIITKSGNSFNLPSPTRTGYTFLGWSTSASATTATYQPGSKYTSNSSVTLYAVWKTYSSVSINTAPTKTTYYIGDVLDTSGLQLTLTYSDGSTENVSSGFTTSGFSSTDTGTKTVTVSYKGLTDTFTVTVKAPTISLSSSSQSLKVGDTSSLTATTTPSGQTVTWTSSNTSVATVSDGTITAKASGNATITAKFTYNGTIYSKTCSVTVAAVPEPVEKTLTSISVSTKPTKTAYEIGETLNTSGLVLKLTYSDGSTENITSGFTTSGFSSASAGAKTVTVIYSGKTATFTVTVNERVIDETTPIITVSSANGVVGSQVKVTVSLSNNPGITSMLLSIGYDSDVLQLVNIEDSGNLGSAYHSDSYTSPYVLSWANDTATSNYNYNGEIVILTFNILENATIGESPITVSYNYDNYDIIDQEMNKVEFSTVNGSVNVTDVIIGDVNGDGNVNTLDRVVLTRYIAKWADYPESSICIEAADVNGDGSVNTLDRVILTRYIAKWSGYTELPYNN